jgi:hypothetical protein
MQTLWIADRIYLPSHRADEIRYNWTCITDLPWAELQTWRRLDQLPAWRRLDQMQPMACPAGCPRFLLLLCVAARLRQGCSFSIDSIGSVTPEDVPGRGACVHSDGFRGRAGKPAPSGLGPFLRSAKPTLMHSSRPTLMHRPISNGKY